MSNNFMHGGTHLPVKNLQETLHYYRTKLGFTDEWIFEDKDGGISRDNLNMLFAEQPDFTGNINNGRHRLPLLWYVANIDEVYHEFIQRGIPLADDLRLHPYGLREFAFIDINGYYIRIAEGKTKKQNLTSLLIYLGYTSVPFRQNAAGQLLMNVKLNDVESDFILDTGAGGTVIEIENADKLRLKPDHSNDPVTAGGIGGHGIQVQTASNNKIEIGDFFMDNMLVTVMSLVHVKQALAQGGATDEFAGIIGADVLKPGKAIIDYNEMKLYLMKL